MQEQCTGIVAARLLHAPPSPTRRRKKNPATGGSGSTSSPLLFLAGGDNHRYLQKEETQKAVDFNFLSFFDLFQSSFFSSVQFHCFSLLCFRRRQDQGFTGD